MFRWNSQRKKEFVSRPLQGRLMMQIGLYWVLYHVFLWHAIFVFRYAEVRLASGGSSAPFSLPELYGQFVRDYYPIIICALITLPIVVVDMMKMTHRIAGPLVRFRRTLRDLSEGKQVPPLKLRKGDLLMEFQDEFNEYLMRLSDRCQPASPAGSKEEHVAQEIGDLSRMVQDAANTSATNGRVDAAST